MTAPDHGLVDPSLQPWGPSLEDAVEALRTLGLPVPVLGGKLLRPALAWALLPPAARDNLGRPFWFGALAIQMVHEASLLHDDILDEAELRRGRTTVVSRDGVGPALVMGDHYLTAAYRAAALADSAPFLHTFIEAVERTVAGEVEQERSSGRVLSREAYGRIIRHKSGELFGAAAVLAGTRADVPLEEARDLGCEVGALYQMVDDFLDYCPAADTGKTPFQDYQQEKYTFVLEDAGIGDFTLTPKEVHERLLDGGAASSLAGSLHRLEECRDRVVERCAHTFGDGSRAAALLDLWVATAREGLEAETAARTGLPAARPEEGVAHAAHALGGPGEWGAYFGTHSRSFRFAARLFPPDPRADVEGVYAFCRFTDDLVDEGEFPVAEARDRLEAWRRLSRDAYDGRETGIPLLDTVMGRMAEGGVPFHYVDDLLTGVGMDLEPVEYATLQELEGYTYRVASVVGGWMTELFGLRDPALLQRAHALGHAMQLTNILRDVGEDWHRGRLYLPLASLEAFGVDREALGELASRGRVPRGYPELMEHLMAVADQHYAAAFDALPCLPGWYRRPVAVAARVYQGIHHEIRRNGYDNGTRRAHTSLLRKLRLGMGGLWDLRRAGAAGTAPGLTTPPRELATASRELATTSRELVYQEGSSTTAY